MCLTVIRSIPPLSLPVDRNFSAVKLQVEDSGKTVGVTFSFRYFRTPRRKTPCRRLPPAFTYVQRGKTLRTWGEQSARSKKVIW